ncbi:hypothetical protein I4U23_018897 [Adineta vaga]|nr:hypothetical protein I4U23_018897 [Adineta vaga]
MTVYLAKRDRCRLCYSLILRDRSTLFSSICCQKYYHLFKHVQRTKIPLKKYHSYRIKVSNRTVCFRDLILRYLRTQIEPIKNVSNFICYDCSKVLLEIEQCAKYLKKTINQLKIKFNKSNRLVTSSLSAKTQKKNSTGDKMQIEQLSISNSDDNDDDDDEFDDIDDDEEEESDNEHDDTKSALPPNIISSNRPKSLHFTSSKSRIGETSVNVPRNNATNRNKTDRQCKDEENDDGDDEEDADEEEEEEDRALRNSTSKYHEPNSKNIPDLLRRNAVSNLNSSELPSLDTTNPALLQLHLAHMLANAAAAAAGQNISHDGNNVDSMMNTFANMQQNFLLKILNDPLAAAQAAQMAAAASALQNKTHSSPIALVSPNKKQSGSGRKRKSTPEKRVITNHRSADDDGDTSPTGRHESMNNSTENINHQDLLDHPLELTLKSGRRPNHDSTTADIQSFVIHSKKENGNSSNVGHYYQHLDEDHKESAIPNDSLQSLSPSGNRRSGSSKRQRLSTSGQLEYINAHNNLSMVSLPQTTTDLLSTNNDDNNSNQRQQHRKLDPRSCAECGKVLFSDKTLLLHCQTHAKNEKQCWICGTNDDDIKKHILNEHGNQKFTNTGFRCQHCDKVFPVFADLETHTKEHSKKKPFECPICHKRFGQQGNLSCHLRIHSGVKPFTCTSCGKAFRHSNSLRRHARTVHSVSRGLTTTPNSLLLPHTTESLSNDIKNDSFDGIPSGLMIPSDDGSSSTGGVPSPSISNTQVDSD